ncbi:hypothetical protein [Streptomyces sp. NPDC048496]|uniref:hypothetical protein n=1 Tax=Streptomyces sp. NPDC048496 TaxID=3365558 RepID=UPI003715E001
MSTFSIWKRTLTVVNTVVEGVRWDGSEQCVIVSVRMSRASDPKPQIKRLAAELGVHPEALTSASTAARSSASTAVSASIPMR